MIRVHIDFETRSAIDLRKAGAHVYSKDRTTDVLCMSYSIGDGLVKLWKHGQPFPSELKTPIAKPREFIFVAHNAAFEFLMWNETCHPKYGWPRIPINRWDCTMVRAFSMGLPGTLDAASKAVGMPFEKDMKGHRIMLQLCRPRKVNNDGSLVWWNPNDSDDKMDIRAKYESLYEYCIQDTIVERELDKRLLKLSPNEKKLWHLDQKINYRGIYLDEAACRKAISVVKLQQQKYNEAINKATNGVVTTCNASVNLARWINDQGIKCDSVRKADVLDLLEDGDTPLYVRKVLTLRREASKSSTAKLNSMITSKSKDGKVRGCFQYYGAASTGRWAGRRIQLQNIKRPTISRDEIEDIMERLAAPGVSEDEAREWLTLFHGSVIDPISNCVRAMLTASPGKHLYGVDFAAIEGRVLAWLANELETLRVYRTHGRIYEHTACQIYNCTMDKIDKDRRLIGKVATLALGFQGGVGAFQSMANVYFIKIPDQKADLIKSKWRAANQRIVQYWYDIERAAMSAVKHPGQAFPCGPRGREVVFKKNGSFLFCRLPSGRPICYPYPKLRNVKTPWGETKLAVTYKGNVYGKFVTRVAYGGLITENVTQATARDLLAASMFRFEENNMPIVMHVHDEIIAEQKPGFMTKEQVEILMCESPAWAKDLPISAEAWEGFRYRK